MAVVVTGGPSPVPASHPMVDDSLGCGFVRPFSFRLGGDDTVCL